MFEYCAPIGGSDLLLCVDPADVSSLVLIDNQTSQTILSRPVVQITQVSITGDDQGDDTLTIDFSCPFWLEEGIDFDAGIDGNDELILIVDDLIVVDTTISRAIYLSNGMDDSNIFIHRVEVTYIRRIQSQTEKFLGWDVHSICDENPVGGRSRLFLKTVLTLVTLHSED